MTELPTHARAPRLLLFAVSLAVMPALVVGLVTGGGSEQADWAQHLVAGLAFGAAFAGFFLFDSGRSGRGAALVGGVGCGWLVVTLIRHGLPGFQFAFVLAGLVVGTGYWLGRRHDRAILLEAVEVAVVSTLGFWALAQLLGWAPPDQVWGSWSNRGWFLGLVTALTACLCGWERLRDSARTGRTFRVIDAVVLALLAAALVRTTDLANNAVAAHHWSVYVAPAEMVREGRALLGQVPSQYGFLNILLLAWLPAGNRFEALYWLQVGTGFVSGAVVYFVLRTWVRAWWWQLGAGVIAFASVTLVCGDLALLTGPMVYPSAGALRFLWVHLLLGYLLWWHRTAAPGAPVAQVLRNGSLLWLGGVLWSVESAFYVTAAWLPAASLLAMTADGDQGPPFHRMRALVDGIGRTLLRVGLYLAGAVMVIGLAYRAIYPSWPQWVAYAEYARAVSGPLLALPMEPAGPGWALLLLQAALLAALFGVSGQRRPLALVWAAWGACWSVSTYFVARSHPNNLAAIAPVLLLGIGVFLEAAKDDRRGIVRPWVWIITVTWLGAVLWLVAVNPAAVRRQLAEYRVTPRAEQLLPAQADVDALLAQCQRERAGPYSVVGVNAFATTTLELTRAHANWLPLRSLALYGPLPVKRREHYLSAYHDRSPLAGWLLAPVEWERNDAYFAWLFEYMDANYAATRYLRNATWQAWYYEPRVAVVGAFSAADEEMVRTFSQARTPLSFLRQFGGTADNRRLTSTASPQFPASGTNNGFLAVSRGSAELQLRVPANRVRVTMVLRRMEGSTGPLAADFVAYASPPDQPQQRYERWRGRVELPAGETEIATTHEIDSSGLGSLFTVSIPAEFAGRVTGGWRGPEITHVSQDSAKPMWLFTGGAPTVPLDAAALNRLLPEGWHPTEAWMRKGWVVDGGIELSPGGEIWLKTGSALTRINGTSTGPVASPRGVGAVVSGLWYKGGRVHLYDPPTHDEIANGHSTFQAWNAEPGGWLVIAADDNPSRTPVVVRITSVSER